MKLIPNPFQRNPADKHYWKGVEHQKKQSYEEARKEYLKAIELDPGYHKAHTNLGSVIMKTVLKSDPNMGSKIQEAENHFKKALELHPESATSLYNLGTISFMYADNESEAFDYFARAINADPIYITMVEQFLGWASYSPKEDFIKVVDTSIRLKTK